MARLAAEHGLDGMVAEALVPSTFLRCPPRRCHTTRSGLYQG
jgi:hypothetical protein